MERNLATLEEIDGRILDLIDLFRLMYPNFNSIGPVDKVVQLLNDAYKANGQLYALIHKGWVK